MARYETKTKPTPEGVDAFLENIRDAAQRADCRCLRELMASAAGEDGKLWGPGMVGFGTHRYRYASGREGDAMAVGFAPRSANIALYITGGFEDQEPVLRRLGRHKIGKGCLYLKRLADVDEGALVDLIGASVARAAEVDVDRA